jgi:hypothetical protein
MRVKRAIRVGNQKLMVRSRGFDDSQVLNMGDGTTVTITITTVMVSGGTYTYTTTKTCKPCCCCKCCNTKTTVIFTPGEGNSCTYGQAEFVWNCSPAPAQWTLLSGTFPDCANGALYPDFTPTCPDNDGVHTTTCCATPPPEGGGPGATIYFCISTVTNGVPTCVSFPPGTTSAQILAAYPNSTVYAGPFQDDLQCLAACNAV